MKAAFTRLRTSTRVFCNGKAIVVNDDGLCFFKRASLSHFCLHCLQRLRAADADLVFVFLEASEQLAAAGRDPGTQPRNVRLAVGQGLGGIGCPC
jgi:hypothetical protein